MNLVFLYSKFDIFFKLEIHFFNVFIFPSMFSILALFVNSFINFTKLHFNPLFTASRRNNPPGLNFLFTLMQPPHVGEGQKRKVCYVTEVSLPLRDITRD